MTPEQHAALMKLLVQNVRNVDTIFGVINDFACLIEAKLDRCSGTGCSEPATVKNDKLAMTMCDSCAARLIVTWAAAPLENDGLLDELHLACADEGLWKDLPDAALVRRLCDYVSYLRRDDVPYDSLQ